jgi:heme/copper-type cytochrome/quinol oxidase subunit 2
MRFFLQELIGLILLSLFTVGTIWGVYAYNRQFIKKKNAILLLAKRGSKWEPDKIVVQEGERVRLWIRNVDKVEHGFYLKEYNIGPFELKVGKDTIIEFIPDKRGEYVFNCVVVCSEEPKVHDGMKGLFIVKKRRVKNEKIN